MAVGCLGISPPTLRGSDPTSSDHLPDYRPCDLTSTVLDVTVQTLGVREPSDFGNAFAEMTRSRPDAILMVSDTLTVLNRK
jgi:hypothetical protein